MHVSKRKGHLAKARAAAKARRTEASETAGAHPASAPLARLAVFNTKADTDGKRADLAVTDATMAPAVDVQQQDAAAESTAAAAAGGATTTLE